MRRDLGTVELILTYRIGSGTTGPVGGEMRIDTLPALLRMALQASLAGRSGDASGFAPIGGAAPGQVPDPAADSAVRTGAAVPHPATSVQMLVALAAIDPAVERRRKQAVEAERGLTLLDQLDRAVAQGAPADEALTALAGWTQTFTLPDDPQLAEIARAVELRVRVELAKHDLIA